MKHILIATISMVFATSYANAEGDPTEFLYQAKGGQSFIQGNINYLSSKQDGVTAAPDTEITDLDFSGKYELGLSDMMSIYAGVGFAQGELDTGVFTRDMNGLNPINLGVKHRMAMGHGQLYVQGNLGLGLIEKQDDNNRTDGSINLAARLGYIMNYESASSGLVLDLGLFSTDGEPKAGDKFKKKGGFAVSAFYEMLMTDMIIGYAATYSLKASPLGISGSGLSSMFTTEEAETSILDFKVYTRIPMNEQLQLLGGLNYGLILDQSDDTLDGGSNLGVNVGVRYLM